MSIDKLKSHYDWLKRMVAEATYMDDKLPLMAELDVADMELRMAIIEGLSIDTLIALVEKCQMPPMSDAENARLRDALAGMRFAYINKDADFPHGFEVEALRKAAEIIGEFPAPDQLPRAENMMPAEENSDA